MAHKLTAQQVQEVVDGAVVKKLYDSNLYDVFLGDGWTNWSRILVKQDFRHVMRGQKLSNEVLQALDFEQTES